MGRLRYSPTKRNEIITSFVQATIDIIKDEGIEDVSIRRVSAKAGYSSATLYRYFNDLDDLISLASVFYLRNYVREIEETGQIERNHKETYRYAWDTFARHALNKPDIYLNLFYGPNSTSLDEKVMAYYSLFPEELNGEIHETLFEMLASGSLLQRNMTVLEPYAAELGYDEEKIWLINVITIAFFRSILVRAIEEGLPLSQSRKDAYLKEFMEGAFFILHVDE